MRKIDIARAFRDEDYYLSLTEAERASLPADPAGPVEVSDKDLQIVFGGSIYTIDSCKGSTYCSPCPPRYCP
jgi:mersacidin/lichenicidin family type 2 lantibiotic